MAVAMEVYQEGGVTSGLAESQCKSLLYPVVEDIIDLLSLLAPCLDCHLTDVSVTLHLTAMDVTLYDVRPEPDLPQLPGELLCDDLSASVPCVGQ